MKKHKVPLIEVYLCMLQILSKISVQSSGDHSINFTNCIIARSQCFVFYHYIKAVLYLGIGFSNGWKETFMSGEQEPWVFRGGLTADLQVYLSITSFLS